MSRPLPDCIGILLCAGSGSRMAGLVADKISAPLAGSSLFTWSLRAFSAAGFFSRIVVVHRGGAQLEFLQREAAAPGAVSLPDLLWVEGGSRRQDSVLAGLETVSGNDDSLVFVHDGARPLVQSDWIQRLRQAAARDGAACLGRWAVDTIKQVRPEQSDGNRCELQDLRRDCLWVMETPQVFPLGVLRDCYRRVCAQGLEVTDDAGAASLAGIPVTLVEADGPNWKITRPADLALAECWLAKSAQPG